jgi:peptidoglycan/xylan/chitin deacetylase (PgdA/CDA1 family)
MRTVLRYSALVLAVSLVAATVRVQAQTGASELPPRKVAITFDDLPAAASNFMTGAEIDDMTARLLATLKRENIPAIGFVNERKLYKWGEVDQRIKALQMWLDDGFELGNHTYSHTSLNNAGLKNWEDDVVQGEPVLRLLLADHKMPLRYLRHPYLDTGLDLQTRREAEAFLSERGYRVAPITIDPWDWMFAPVYADLKQHRDAATAQRVVAAYLAYADAVFDYCEKLSKQIIGYEPKQIILLHATELEADHFSDLAAVLRKRGYSFITLDEALSDSAYNLPDTYVGEGTGWLDHWAISQGKLPPNGPEFPAWVLERARALHQTQP